MLLWEKMLFVTSIVGNINVTTASRTKPVHTDTFQYV